MKPKQDGESLIVEREGPSSDSAHLGAPAVEQLAVELPPADTDPGIEGIAAPGHIQDTFVGDCLDARHPTLLGRVLVRWVDALGSTRERWLPTLHGLAIRQTDRVLVQQPSNWYEPIVIGVIDGYARRPDVPAAAVATIALNKDEAIRVTTAEGHPLLELRGSDKGPVVRLLAPDMEIETPGQLKLSARGIELNATGGAVSIKASDDVTVQGEVIRLN